MTIMPNKAAAVITYQDGAVITITADDTFAIAELRRFAQLADQPGETCFASAVTDGAKQPIVINHSDLASVRLVTS